MSIKLSPKDVAAWLLASYNEERKGVIEYEKLYRYVKDDPEYAPIKKLLKRIIKDEKKHVSMLVGFVNSEDVSENPRRHTWHVWNSREKELCKGSRSKCLSFYKRHGGTRSGLTLGYYA